MKRAISNDVQSTGLKKNTVTDESQQANEENEQKGTIENLKDVFSAAMNKMIKEKYSRDGTSSGREKSKTERSLWTRKVYGRSLERK